MLAISCCKKHSISESNIPVRARNIFNPISPIRLVTKPHLTYTTFHLAKSWFFSCHQSCFKRAQQKHNLKIHIYAIHEGKKLHKCSICDLSFAQKQYLKIHVYSLHEGKKSHKCSICDYSCTRKGNLRIHIDAIHEGKKPHKCSICDYSSTRKDKLKNHIKEVHEWHHIP